MKQIIKAKHAFERLELSKEQAMDLFSYNKFKTYLIDSKIPDGGHTSVYRIGDFIDLCTGPHVPHTGHIKVMHLVKNSSAYWLGSAENESL
jgi:threonyl-tRNA synthetase